MSRTHLLLLLAFATALSPFTMHSIAPVLPEIARHFDVSPGSAQMLISLGLGAMALSTLFIGAFSDILGRRPVLLWCLGGAFVGGLMAALAPTIEVAVIGRVIQAAGATAGMVLARAVAIDLYDRAGAQGFIARMTAVMAVAPMIAPFAGGAIAAAFGWRAVFWFGVALGAVAPAWAWMKMPETLTEKGDRFRLANLRSGIAYAAASREFWAWTLYSSFQISSFYFFVGAAPFVMAEAYGIGPAAYGTWFFAVPAMFILGNLSSGRVSQWLGERGALVFGAGVCMVGAALGVVLISAGLDAPAVLFIPAIANAYGAGVTLPASVAAAVSARAERAGSASSLVGVCQFAMAGLAAQAGGYVDHGSAMPVAVMMFIFVGLGVSAWAALLRVRVA